MWDSRSGAALPRPHIKVGQKSSAHRPGEHLEGPSHGALGTRTTSTCHHVHSSFELQFPLELLNSKPAAVILEVAIHLHTTHTQHTAHHNGKDCKAQEEAYATTIHTHLHIFLT